MTTSLEGNDVTVNLLRHVLVAILHTYGFAPRSVRRLIRNILAPTGACPRTAS